MFNRNEIVSFTAPERKHYPWHELEEYHPNGGMWAIVSNALTRRKYILATQELMCDTQAFKEAMRTAVVKWPKSTSVAMTTPGLNKKAWLGHAGCFLATGSPEETTRLGWHELDEAEQFAANEAAEQIIYEWRQAQTTDNEQMGLFNA